MLAKMFNMVYVLNLPQCYASSTLNVSRKIKYDLCTKSPLGRPRRRWEDNIRMDLEGIGVNAGNLF